MFRLNIYGFIVGLDGFFVLLEFIICGSQIAMICCNSMIDFNCSGSEPYLFFKVPLLSQCFAFEVEEITRFVVIAEVKPLIACVCKLFPLFEVQIGIGKEKILLFSTGHAKCKFQELFVLLLSLQLFDFLSHLLVHFHHHGTTLLEIIQFYFHLSQSEQMIQLHQHINNLTHKIPKFSTVKQSKVTVFLDREQTYHLQKWQYQSPRGYLPLKVESQVKWQALTSHRSQIRTMSPSFVSSQLQHTQSMLLYDYESESYEYSSSSAYFFSTKYCYPLNQKELTSYLQKGHLFEVQNHFQRQSKQNLCLQSN